MVGGVRSVYHILKSTLTFSLLIDRSVPPIAASLLARLAQRILNHEVSVEVIRRHQTPAVEAFYLLLEEFYSCQLDRLKVLETVLLAYVQIYYSIGMDGECTLTMHLPFPILSSAPSTR